MAVEYDDIVQDDLENEEFAVPTWMQYGLRCKNKEVARFEKQKIINEEECLNEAITRAKGKEPIGNKQRGKFADQLKPDVTYHLDRTWASASNPVYYRRLKQRDEIDKKMLEKKRKQAQLLDNMVREKIGTINK